MKMLSRLGRTTKSHFLHCDNAKLPGMKTPDLLMTAERSVRKWYFHQRLLSSTRLPGQERRTGGPFHHAQNQDLSGVSQRRSSISRECPRESAGGFIQGFIWYSKQAIPRIHSSSLSKLFEAIAITFTPAALILSRHTKTAEGKDYNNLSTCLQQVSRRATWIHSIHQLQYYLPEVGNSDRSMCCLVYVV